MLIFGHMATSLRETFPTRKSEWVLGFMLFAWGIVVLSVPNLFETRPAFSTMERLLTQHSWAWLAIGIGGLRISMLFVNGTWRRSPHLRAVGSFLAAGVWFFIGIGLVTSGQAATGLVTYGGLFVLDALNFCTSAGEAGVSDNRYGVGFKRTPMSVSAHHARIDH